MTRAFLIAGEASGDALGAALIRGLRRRVDDLSLEGIAGPLMQAEGMASRFPMSELSVMGLAEILPRYRHLRRRMIQTAEAVVAARPDVLVTIDSPDFCLRVARRVRAAAPGIRIVHYVAPSVWAWRPGRARAMAPFVDEVLALLPFEPEHMRQGGVDCIFVGHPVVSAPRASADEVAAFRADAGLREGAPLLLALPGSRRSEVSCLAPVFGAALARFAANRPDLGIVLPVAPGVADMIDAHLDGWPGIVHLLRPDHPDAAARKRAAFAAADIALAASGTVSLELAANETPMVIAYDMAWLSRQIIGRMLRIDTVTLVNLVSDTRAVPEFLGPACRPELIAPALEALLADPSAQREAARITMERLGKGGPDPGERAADAVLALLGR